MGGGDYGRIGDFIDHFKRLASMGALLWESGVVALAKCQHPLTSPDEPDDLNEPGLSGPGLCRL